MNKKGFTIIELLAVMAILSLLIVIIISGTSGTKTRAVEKAKNIEKKKIIDAAISYYESNADTYDSLISSGSYSCKVSVEKLRSSKIYDTDKFVNENINDNTLVKVTNDNGNVYASILSSDDASLVSCDAVPASNFIHNLIKEEDDPSSPEVINIGEGSLCTYTLAYDGTEDNNLRYVGADPCNFVKFNDELWRIVGVMNNVDDGTGRKETRIKLIRKESLGNFSWDSSPHDVQSGLGINDWTQADLMNELNGDYLNLNLSSNTTWYNYCDGQKTAVFDYTKRLNSLAQSQIGDAKWYLGGFSLHEEGYVHFIPKNMYPLERSTNTCSTNNKCNDSFSPRATEWTGKVALIYPSDYGYATTGGQETSRTKCINNLAAFLNDSYETWSKYPDCENNDWLKPLNYPFPWFITPATYSGYSAHFFNGGQVLSSPVCNTYKVLPSVYLKKEVIISGGSGTRSDPYTLS